MARIQVLQLGVQTAGAFSKANFAVIIDRLDPQDHLILLDGEQTVPLKSELGASAVLVYDGELTVENMDEALTEMLAPKIHALLEAGV